MVGRLSIGLYSAAFAAALGAHVDYVDTDPQRLAAAEKLGAVVHDVAKPDKSWDPYPVTVHTTGDSALLSATLRATWPDGVCTDTGIYPEYKVEMPLLPMYTRGVQFVTGRVSARTVIPRVLELLAGGLDLSPAVDRVVGVGGRALGLADDDRQDRLHQGVGRLGVLAGRGCASWALRVRSGRRNRRNSASAHTESPQRTLNASAAAHAPRRRRQAISPTKTADPAQLHACQTRQPLNIGAVGAGGQNPWVGDVHLAAGAELHVSLAGGQHVLDPVRLPWPSAIASTSPLR